MPWLGDDDVLSRAEATARRAWCALFAAAAEDVRAILAGEALAYKWRCTRPSGSRCPYLGTASSVGRSRCHDRPACALPLTKSLIELAPFSLTKPRQVLSQRKNCKQQTQAPMRAHATQHPRLQEHLARYRDCARVSRRTDRLHGKTSWKATCCYALSVMDRILGESG
jgi:hypothetical protein